jgi:hypothetical protein
MYIVRHKCLIMQIQSIDLCNTVGTIESSDLKSKCQKKKEFAKEKYHEEIFLTDARISVAWN